MLSVLSRRGWGSEEMQNGLNSTRIPHDASRRLVAFALLGMSRPLLDIERLVANALQTALLIPSVVRGSSVQIHNVASGRTFCSAAPGGSPGMARWLESSITRAH